MIIWMHIYHKDVTTIELETHLESLKTYFDENEDATLADITEKIRKLPKSSKVYFSQVTAVLQISLVLPASMTMIPITQGRLNHCMLLAIYKDMAHRLSLIDVANEFCFGSDERSRF